MFAFTRACKVTHVRYEVKYLALAVTCISFFHITCCWAANALDEYTGTPERSLVAYASVVRENVRGDV